MLRSIALLVASAMPLLAPADDASPPAGPYEIDGKRFELVDGAFTDIDGSVSVADLARGDLDADGVDDLVVVLVQNSRGTGVFFYLNVLLGTDGGGYSNAGSGFLGDRIRLDRVKVDGAASMARIALRKHAPDQAMADKPSLAVERGWRVVDRSLAEVDPAELRGSALIAPFKRDLKAALVAGMAQGPGAAIAACNTQAPGIAAALSVDGVRMGRTSHRLRNPANEGPDWVTPVLEQYLEDESRAAPKAVQLDDGRVGYVEPIPLAPLCVNCHGRTLAPDVADTLARLYPDDEATGFDVGDLRGVFWVEFPAD